MFTEPNQLAKVEETLHRIVGQPIKIRVEWIDAADGGNGAAGKSAATVAMGQQRLQRTELMQIPFVKKLADVLGAQIIRADDGFGAVAKNAASQTEEVNEGE